MTVLPSGRARARALVALLGATLASTAVAQRLVADFKVKDHKAAIEYGVPRSGKHKLDDLPVGGSPWRMGNNNPSLMTTDLPLVAGDSVLAPGVYRVNIARPGEKEFALNFDFAGSALGTSGSVGFTGEPVKLDKPASKLEIAFAPAGKDDPHAKPAKVTVNFSTHKLEIPVTVVGFKSSKAGDWALDVFTYPKDVLTKRLADGAATPLASIRRADPNDNRKTLAYNVVVTKSGAKLVPWMTAPTENNGFGAAKLPEGDEIKEGKAEWTVSTKTSAALDLEKAEFKKGEGLTLRLLVGDQAGVLTFPDPLAGPKKA
jgi:hypothetical protein